MLKGILWILTVFIYASAYASQLQDGLTDSQIQRIFHRSRDELPNYKTATLKTPVNHRSKREIRPVEFDVDGKKIQLELTPSEHNSFPNHVPVWTVETDRQKSSGHTYKKLDQSDVEYDGIFYEDKENMATLLAYYRNQNIYYDGVFGESTLTKVIRSVPEKWWQVPGNQSNGDHVVFDVNPDKSNTEAIGENGKVPDSDKLDKPLDVLYPKLLLVVEHGYFKALGEDVRETIKYVATFWNSVNLKYSELTSPKVKIVITGVIIAKDDTALDFIHASRIPPEMKQVNHFKLLTNANDYFLNEFKKEVDFVNFDSTITMARLDTGSIAGSAFVGNICATSNNVGFINDDASFSGIQTATHELGHLLNLPHDGAGAAQECGTLPDEKIGTIMYPFMLSVEKFVWSECSKRIIHDFATTKRAECLERSSRV